ncbi:MAG: VCBS repeat-containing protein, partial [Phycisphaerales bacterium]|nr:VCBS repeat-containing protein [Phycisphaerales bacterium]
MLFLTALGTAEVPIEPLRQYPTGFYSSGVLVEDLDGDGHIDIAISNRGSNDVTIRYNNGSGYFPDRIDVPTGYGPRYVDGADFDNDGDIDLCTPDYTASTTTVLRNDGGGVFTTTHTFELDRTVFLWTDDIDLDGNHDIIVLQWDSEVPNPSSSAALMTPFYGDGQGDFEPGTEAYIGVQPRCGVAGDLNGDGFVDI